MPKIDNKAVAAVFAEMADLLQIQGGDPYRIRAFRRSSRVIEMLGEPLTTLLDRNAIETVPGLGEGSAHRIKQILRTGSCDDLRKLHDALPTGLRELLDVKGIGPRTVRVLWSHLRVGSLDELEAACKAGKLRALPRMGEQTEERLLHAIADHRKRASRVRLSRALRTGRAIVAAMRELPEVQAAELGGSARRGKSTVGDLDILVAADDRAPVTARFVTLPNVAEILWSGEGRTSIRLDTRQQVDLRVLPVENFGAGLHYFTGSQLHNIALRGRGNRLGLHISEHGVSRRSDPEVRLISGRFEADIFAAVGLPFIPPELRENNGEIEAAAAGRLPTLVEVGDLRGDLHMHTVESDGSGTALRMAETAADLGLDYIAITDHSKSLTVANGLDETRILKQQRQLHDTEQRLGRLRILSGIEVDILDDGALDLDRDVLRGLDWVVGSIHSKFDLDEDEQTERIIRAMESGLVDCIGHPTGRRLGERGGLVFDLERVLKVAVRTGVAMECNGSPHRMDLDDVGCRACRDQGVPVVINTDSHAPDHLQHREYGLASARRGWLEKKDVLNAWPVGTLADRRRDRLRTGGVAVSRPEPAPEPPPATRAPTPGLAKLLEAPLAPEILARVQRWLQDGDDPDLEAALREISDNPLGKAYELVVLSAP